MRDYLDFGFGVVLFYFLFVLFIVSSLRGCLHGGGPALLVGLALPRGLDFTWEKLALLPGLARLAESPGLTTFISPRNPESRYLRTSFHFISYT